MKAKKIETIDESKDEDFQEEIQETEDFGEEEKKEVKKSKKSKKVEMEESEDETVESEESVEETDVQETSQDKEALESLEDKIKKKKQKEIEQYNFQYTKEEKKIIVDENAIEIKNLSLDKRVLGTKEVVRNLMRNKLKKIFITKNAPKNIVLEIEHLAKLSDVHLVYLKNTNNELGIVCRKPFGISLLGVLK